MKNEDENFTIEHISYSVFAIFGVLLLLVGYIGMEHFQKLQQQLTEIDILQKNTKYKNCQSCGRNFSSIIKHGKELDGSENLAFCIDCYDNGVFKETKFNLERF